MSTPTTIETNGEVQAQPSISPQLPGKEPKRRWWVWLLALAVLGYGAYRVRKGLLAPQATTAAQGPNLRVPTVPVVGATARKGDIGVYFTGLGAVTPIYTVTVKSQIAGYLMQVLYREGQIVQKGDPLVEIDPRPYQVMLENAQAGLFRGPSQPRQRESRPEALSNARSSPRHSGTTTRNPSLAGEVG